MRSTHATPTRAAMMPARLHSLTKRTHLLEHDDSCGAASWLCNGGARLASGAGVTVSPQRYRGITWPPAALRTHP